MPTESHSVFTPAVIARLAGEDSGFGLIGGTGLFQFGEDVGLLTLGADVHAMCQHASVLVRIVDHLGEMLEASRIRL
jgi:hypothetical protein